MRNLNRIFIGSALVLFLATLIFGLLASWAFLYPEVYNRFLPFHQLRPFHVSAALFWIITGATASILVYKNEVLTEGFRISVLEKVFMYTWLITICAVFLSYGLKIFGGREYWEFPPVLCVPLLLSWVALTGSYFKQLFQSAANPPMYVWMWSTGIFFFLLTFIEQNLWHISWFRESFLREITVQWKANGSLVGSWNQMIYGTSLFLMVKISGNEKMARGNTVFFFYMLGLTNLMFNWGHHIYNVPTASWIRTTSYIISMTEWLFLIKMIAGFRKTLEEHRRLKHLITYRFIIASEFWVFMNLLLAIAMSIPAINRYTHGTHITVAHAMGATIGINTMLLLASIGFMLGVENFSQASKRFFNVSFRVGHFSFAIFWLSLIAAGVLKAYRETGMGIDNFQLMMKPVLSLIKVFSVAGIGVLLGMGAVACIFLYHIFNGGSKKIVKSDKGNADAESKILQW